MRSKVNQETINQYKKSKAINLEVLNNHLNFPCLKAQIGKSEESPTKKNSKLKQSEPLKNTSSTTSTSCKTQSNCTNSSNTIPQSPFQSHSPAQSHSKTKTYSKTFSTSPQSQCSEYLPTSNLMTTGTYLFSLMSKSLGCLISKDGCLQ